MLTIRPEQVESIDAAQTRAFRDELRGHVQATYPEYARVPERVMGDRIDCAIRRARAYGFESGETIGHFIGVMARFAANFDLHPAIHAALVNDSVPIEERIDVMTDRLPDGVWREAMGSASSIGWFLADDAFSAGVVPRVASALTRTGASKDAETSPTDLVAQVERWSAMANAIGWRDEDALFVFSAASLAYGDGFVADRERHPWTAQVFDPGTRPKIQAALLRMRMALDHQLWI